MLIFGGACNGRVREASRSNRPSTPQRNRLAAIDHEGRAGDEAAGIRGEQQQCAVEVAVLAEAADRNFPGDLGPPRWSGIFAIESVTNQPGAIAFTRMPLNASSRPSAFVI